MDKQVIKKIRGKLYTRQLFTRRWRLLGQAEPVMHKLKGVGPGKAMLGHKRRTHTYMRRNMSMQTAARVNAFYAELGWTERWFIERT